MGGIRFKVTNVFKTTSNVIRHFFKSIKDFLEPQSPQTELPNSWWHSINSLQRL